jgi:hypothetical protein
MRTLLLLSVALTLGCTGREPPLPPPPARSAIGLVGDWVRFAPASLSGDTLTLRTDSTAAGIVPWANGQLAVIKRWKIKFTSRDAVAAREDWAQGHADGGDGDCVFDDGAGCISGPVLCLGAGQQYQCEAFRYTGDSLTLSHGSRFVRSSRQPSPARTTN